MRTNRPIEEYIAMLHIDIDTLEAAARHLEIAIALYQTKFVAFHRKSDKVHIDTMRHMMECDLRSVRYDIESINIDIEHIKWKHGFRARWRNRNADAVSQISENSDALSQISDDELPF